MKLLTILVGSTALASQIVPIEEMEAMETEMLNIGTGVCQAWANKNFYDLRAFDEVGKKGFSAPANVGDASGKFLFKVCDAPFQMKPTYIDETSEKLPASCNGL